MCSCAEGCCECNLAESDSIIDLTDVKDMKDYYPGCQGRWEKNCKCGDNCKCGKSCECSLKKKDTGGELCGAIHEQGENGYAADLAVS